MGYKLTFIVTQELQSYIYMIHMGYNMMMYYLHDALHNTLSLSLLRV
jgi:hypothetical protein